MPRVDLGDGDNGRSVCVTLGGSVTVILPGDGRQIWDPVQASGTGLVEVTGLTFPAEASGARYTAAQRGTVTVESSRAACPPTEDLNSVSCQARIPYRVTVQVS